MSNVIFKYPLEIVALQHVEVPERHHVLEVAYQGKQLCMWAMVDDRSPKMSKTILIYGTGDNSIPNNLVNTHIGTVHDGKFVWHVFESLNQT